MEFLEGQTLAQRLAKGRLPLDEVLRIGAEIADAISAAHRHGVIHRDLKPTNIMLARNGGASGPPTVKLLDFGLAKVRDQAIVAEESAGPTETESITNERTLVGTLPYMAPEQVEGKPVEARTDIWALGCVLYEMVTGARAFSGDSRASLIAAIMSAEPPAVGAEALSPPALDRLIKRCLAKSPDDRWDGAHDVADELRWIAQTATVAARAQTRTQRRTGSRTLAIVAALVVAGAAVAMSFLWRVRLPAATPAVVQLDVAPADELNAGGRVLTWLPTAGGSRTALSWTPDGRALVFVGRKEGRQQLYVRELNRREARLLVGTEGAQVPVVSPDGAWVAFWSDGAIRRVALAGGPAVVVCQGPESPPAGMSWSTTNHVVYASLEHNTIWQVPSAGGTPSELTTLASDEQRHVLPGGIALMYTVRRYERIWSREDVVVQALVDGVRKVLLQDAVDARFVPTGHLVFMRHGTLTAVRFDVERLEVRGDAVPLVENVAQALVAGNTADVTGAAHFSVSSSGNLAYVDSTAATYPSAAVLAVDRNGRTSAVPVPDRSYGPVVRASPDGLRLALMVQSAEEQSLWLYDFERGGLDRLTAGGEADPAEWTPDAQRVSFAWNRAGTFQLFHVPTDGSGPSEPLVKANLLPAQWAAGGRELLVVKDVNDIWVVRMAEPEPTVTPVVASPAIDVAPALSPDGRFLAYQSDRSGRREIYIQPYPDMEGRVQVSIDGGMNPAWNPMGGELFFVGLAKRGRNEPARLMVVPVRTDPVLSVGRPRPLFDLTGLRFTCNPVRCYDVAPDGRGFYSVRRARPEPAVPVTHIHLILNWHEELKARVGGGQ